MKLVKIMSGEYITKDGKFKIEKNTDGCSSVVCWDILAKDGEGWEWDERCGTKKEAKQIMEMRHYS